MDVNDKWWRADEPVANAVISKSFASSLGEKEGKILALCRQFDAQYYKCECVLVNFFFFGGGGGFKMDVV